MTKLSLRCLSVVTIACASTLAHAASLQWTLGDYQLAVVNQESCHEGFKTDLTCTPGKLKVTNNKLGISQIVEVESLHLNKKEKPYFGTLARNGENPTRSIVLADVNFDTFPDLMVQSGFEGGYGGPSYTAFLYDKNTKKFVESAAFSEATQGNLGMFTIVNGRLHSGTKDGCCYHTEDAYEVRNNEPILVERIIQERGKPDVVERLVNGKMRRVKR